MGLMGVYHALVQIPGVDVVELTFREQIATNWVRIGFMRWPLLACVIVGMITIAWKFLDLLIKSAKTKKILAEVDGLLEDRVGTDGYRWRKISWSRVPEFWRRERFALPTMVS